MIVRVNGVAIEFAPDRSLQEIMEAKSQADDWKHKYETSRAEWETMSSIVYGSRMCGTALPARQIHQGVQNLISQIKETSDLRSKLVSILFPGRTPTDFALIREVERLYGFRKNAPRKKKETSGNG
jgi:hypothetical protein